MYQKMVFLNSANTISSLRTKVSKELSSMPLTTERLIAFMDEFCREATSTEYPLIIQTFVDLRHKEFFNLFVYYLETGKTKASHFISFFANFRFGVQIEEFADVFEQCERDSDYARRLLAPVDDACRAIRMDVPAKERLMRRIEGYIAGGRPNGQVRVSHWTSDNHEEGTSAGTSLSAQ